MNLVIDIGNSAAKLAVYHEDEMMIFMDSDRFGMDELEKILSGHPEISGCIMSSVRKEDPGLISLLKESIAFFLALDHNTPLPIRNLYRSKSTLGYDRIASAVGASSRFPGQDILIIDAGTAITIDLVTADNSFTGGNITPGLAMRYRALHEFTDNLPLADGSQTSEYLGTSTESAIISGVVNGIIYELDGYINDVKSRYSELKAVMTGGDAKIFDKKLKNSIFVDSHLNLLGLHRILQYNAEV